MFSDIRYRIRALFRRDLMETELAEEIRLHVEREVEESVRRGVGPDEARRLARLALGGQEQVKEECRDARGVALIRMLIQDLRYAARLLRKSPGYSGAAILTLALCIGSTTAIFTIINSFLLRPLPVYQPHRLVGIRELRVDRPIPFLDPYAWEQIRNRPNLFESVCGWTQTRFNIAERGQADNVEGLGVSGEFFETLGVPAMLGRMFTRADDRKGGGPDGPVAVISHGFWQRRFGGAGNVIGRSVSLDRTSYIIVGVAPPRFFGAEVGRSFDVAVPIAVTGTASWLYVTARLRPDQTPESATAALRAAQPQIREAALPKAVAAGATANLYLSQPLSATPAATGQATGSTPLRDRFERPLWAMLLLAILVVLIACANVANLVLARAVARRHELSVRRALGASGSRLACQVLAESLLLSVIGASLGLVMAGVFSEVLVGMVSSATSPIFLDLSLDWRVLGFTAAISVGTALLFGLIPALRAARVQPQAALREGGRSQASAKRVGVNHALIVAEVSLSLILVVAAGLFVQTFTGMATTVGFDQGRTLILRLNANDAKVPPAARPALYERVRQAVATVPGVSDAVTLRTVPVSSDHWVANVMVSGYPPPAAAEAPTFLNAVGPGYFAVFGTPILEGRGFAAEDRSGTPLVAVVNETFARRHVGDRSPIGETLTFGETGTYSPPFRIVGLAKDSGSAIYFGLREGIPSTVYLSIGQMNPEIANFAPPAAFRVAVRFAAGSPAALARAAAVAVNRIAPDMRVDAKSMASYVRDNIATERLTAMLSGLFGALSLLLAAVGVYGVVAYAVMQRRSEIGIRLALGASPAEVIRMLLIRTARVVGVGLAIGGAISFWTSRFVAALLFGLEPRDPATFASAAVVLAAVGLLAGWLPARQAARIDPVSTLRTE